jgi:hypothetical protein
MTWNFNAYAIQMHMHTRVHECHLLTLSQRAQIVAVQRGVVFNKSGVGLLTLINCAETW